jgi:hypothetical protein
MLHVAGPTLVFWTTAVGMGFAVDIVVIILLNLLNKSVQALDTRVDHVWEAAAAVHGLTGTVGPQLKTAEAAVGGLVGALRGGAPTGTTRPAAAAPTRTAAAPATPPAAEGGPADRSGGVATPPPGGPSFRPRPTGRRW